MSLVRGERRATLIAMNSTLGSPSSYPELLQDLKARVRGAQVRAALAVNRELVLLYWSIGRDILARQGSEGWGAKVIERLAHDLQFPGVDGFSPRSLKTGEFEPEYAGKLSFYISAVDGTMRTAGEARSLNTHCRTWYSRSGCQPTGSRRNCPLRCGRSWRASRISRRWC